MKVVSPSVNFSGRETTLATSLGSGGDTCPGKPWLLCRNGNPASGGPGVSSSQCELTYGPGEPALLAVGEVRMVEEEMSPFVIT